MGGKSAFEIMQKQTKDKILTILQPIEMNLICDLYHKPELMDTIKLKTEDFTSEIGRVYYSILYSLVKEQKKKEINEYVIGIYLESNPGLKRKYDEYRGYEVVSQLNQAVNEKNFESYIDDMQKWLYALHLNKKGFPIGNYMTEISNHQASYLHDFFESILEEFFDIVDQGIKAYNIFDGLYDFIEELDKGEQTGIPFYNAKYLTRETGGWNINGNIYGLGSLSGTGKSTMAFNYLVPSVMKRKEKIVFIVNEEDEKKMKKELLIWIVNNVLIKEDEEKINKFQLREGHFSEHEKNLLRDAAKMADEMKEKNIFTVIPLERYSVNHVVKIIKKFRTSYGVRMFVLDTLKESFDAKTDEIYKSMMRDMVTLYDTVKPSALNVGLFVTYQLSKNSARIKYLTDNEIGQAKSIIDVMSVNLMMRRPSMKEVEELQCFTFDGANGNTKLINKKMDPNKQYMITFITKNRFGATNDKQIVSECNLGTNICKDVYYCNVAQDW